MASGQTMSSPTDWLSQSYHTDFFNTETPPPPAAAAPASRTTTTTNLSPDQGRVSKPIRRRSRASRRTPTTLLNTDTSNFRAMVQRFTGGPAAAFPAVPQVPIGRGGGGTLNFMDQMAGGGREFHLQYANQELQQQQQQQHMMFMMGGRGGGAGGAADAPPTRGGSGNENRSYENYLL